MGKAQEADKMRSLAPIFCPDCLGLLICGSYYIKNPLFRTFCKPKYSKVDNLVENFLFWSQLVEQNC